MAFRHLLLAMCLSRTNAADTMGPKKFTSTCGSMKKAYKDSSCCGSPDKVTHHQVVPMHKVMTGVNPCEGKKPKDGHVADDKYFDNINCTRADGVVQALEQSGTNVTLGYKGLVDTDTLNRKPITTTYLEAGLCPVNVHWHLGTEHLSVGQYDENGKGPAGHRRLAADDPIRGGHKCHHYDSSDTKFTKEYDWKYCVGMKVGETYEVHWPHSAAGACGTPNQYQSPFYDGVFCRDGIISLGNPLDHETAPAGGDNPLNTFQKIGVQAQIFTIVNDDSLYYPDLLRGMIVDGDYGSDIAKYTGSTTGTSRSNEVCSMYTPITWQVDRKCHMISASSFDKMCADMLAQRDDMSQDLYAHGAREIVADELAANNHQRL